MIMQGLGDGMMYPNVLVYIAEISSKELRGSLCNVVNICFCLGLCLTFSLAMLVPWRTLTWILIAPVLLSLLGLSLVPETPHWLAQRNKTEEALRILAVLRNNCQTEEEERELRDKYREQEFQSVAEKVRSKLKTLTSRPFLRRVFN